MQRRVAQIAFVAIACSLIAPAPRAAMRSEQITPESAPELLIGGPEAIGGVGDWYLANDVVEVIVDDVSRRFAKANHGGTLVDAGLLDREGEDQLARFFPIVNLDQRVFLDFDTVRATFDEEEGWARLVVSNSGRMDSVPRDTGFTRWFDPLVPASDELAHVAVETEYAVFRGEPYVHITTTFRNDGPHPAPVFAYGDVWMRGGRSGRSWVGNSLHPEASHGFHHASFDRRNILGSGGAVAAFTHLVVPGVPGLPEITYALVAPERAARRLLQFGVTGDHVTLFSAFVGDPDWDSLGVLRLARATRTELASGESWSFRRRLLIAGRSDVAAATDVIFPLLDVADGSSGIEGRVVGAGVRHVIHVRDAASGAPVTQIAVTGAEAPGALYRAVLAPGDYRLEVLAESRGSQALSVRVEPHVFTQLGEVRLPEPGWLVFDPAFADGGPGRVVFEGVGDTPDPAFGAELLDFRIDGRPSSSGSEMSEWHFAGNGTDPKRVAVPPGRYRLTAERGIEHDVATQEVDVPGPGSEVRVAPFALRRVVSVPGHVASDLHVHAAASDDSAMSNEARLRSYLATGIDVIVSTDHDHVGNFAPALAALGVGDRIRVIQGVEVTSSAPSRAAPWTIGHHNAFPIRFQPLAHRQGAPPSQEMELADLYSMLRSEYGAKVIQMNHPRDDDPDGIDEENFLTHLGDVGRPFDPTRPIDEPPNDRLLAPGANGRTRAIDFDAIELLNGAGFGKYLENRRVWHALLRQGFRRTATANSDSHGPDEIAGYPRNYVPGARGEAFDLARFIAAIRRGRIFGSSGPLLTVFRANGASMGDRVAAPDGRVAVEIEVQAAPWVPVDEVRLLVNGETKRSFDTRGVAAGETVRLREQVELTLPRDAFLTLEAGVPLDVDKAQWRRERGGVYAGTVVRDHLPVAYTNPIFIDVDGNGRFDPPGLAPGGGASPRNLWPALVLLALLSFWLWRRRGRGTR